MGAMPMMTPVCFCNLTIRFKHGRNSNRCPICDAYWLRDASGFWAMRRGNVLFTPKDKWLNRKGGAA